MRLSSSLLQNIGKQAYTPNRLKKVLNYGVTAFACACFTYSCVLLFNMASSYANYQTNRKPMIEAQKRELEAAMMEKSEIERQAGLR